ncbi:MAG: C10 family peptidase, partial [candidate division Zixibacteria bacterium]|nr:C10 family peptidase [candidate division Zixibacteria bacterium]
MRSVKVKAVFYLVFAFLLMVGSTANAERASIGEMDQVCENWLTNIISKTGDWAGSSDAAITSVSEITDGDLVLARCYHISPQGYVVVPVLKDLPPIKVSSDKCDLDVTKTGGMAQLIKDQLKNRNEAYIKAYGSLDAIVQKDEEYLFSAAHRVQWDNYSISKSVFKTSLSKDVVEQVGPLMTVSWHQSEPYNNYCPIGFEGDRTVVGCVATAAAQIMKYHEWPPFGYGDHTYYWNGDNSCEGSTSGGWLSADFSDGYNWSDMPDDCFGSCTPEQDDALAEFNYEVGIAFEMDYGVCGSGSWASPSNINRYETNFRYLDQMLKRYRSGLSPAIWFDWIKDDINDSLPIWYTITGHMIVCDGWRIFDDSTKQYHMNYGWDDYHTAWYTLDNYYCPAEGGCSQNNETMVIRIEPNKGIMFTEDTNIGWVPFDVNFSGSSAYTVYGWQWDFGDGYTDNVQAPIHTYETQGMHDVTLVIDTGGDTLSIQRPQHIIALADSLVGDNISGKPDST